MRDQARCDRDVCLTDHRWQGSHEATALPHGRVFGFCVLGWQCGRQACWQGTRVAASPVGRCPAGARETEEYYGKARLQAFPGDPWPPRRWQCA